ncbi:MAG TPA: hypothetical protein PLX20_06000 [Rhodocyclaceae bacterium]|nr:hypothetical protein [Rhodocyclaceae bacterium]HMZ83323.1 hypothetical protein [Rhodocyclaceae bacterium]HNA03468.1 hypothetical protein [Rhodocyclaceae bacterium]HNB79534.1 hypothetical protein [Rhodocyclaceae bacterium]HNH12664.1 hypothetical protein [Rhodocyclaceae bacterium]
MKEYLAGVCVLGLLVSIAARSADDSSVAAALERERAQAAARDKAADEAHRREAQEMQAVAKASMARDYRLRLGNEAKGKSDDEVIRLYREKEIAAGRTP